MNFIPTYCNYGFCSKPGIKNYNNKFFSIYGVKPDLENAQNQLVKMVKKMLRGDNTLKQIGKFLVSQQRYFLQKAQFYDNNVQISRTQESKLIWGRHVARAVANIQACYILYNRLIKKLDKEKRGRKGSPFYGKGSPQRKGSSGYHI